MMKSGIFGKLFLYYLVLMCFTPVRFLFKLIEVSTGNQHTPSVNKDTFMSSHKDYTGIILYS